MFLQLAHRYFYPPFFIAGLSAYLFGGMVG
jgi:hypothetical protein